jgi:hypothetical protein
MVDRLRHFRVLCTNIQGKKIGAVHAGGEIEIQVCPSKAILYDSGSMEEFSVVTVARIGNCQIFLLNFQWEFD